MANEVRTLGGTIATIGTAVAAGVTLGKVKTLNKAAEECAKYTVNAASNTIVRHVGETAGSAVATAGTAVAAGVTLGQIDGINKAVVSCAKNTEKAAIQSGKEALNNVNLVDGVPVVGHVKGGIHYIAGDKDGGERAMNAASKTTRVITGGIVGEIFNLHCTDIL